MRGRERHAALAKRPLRSMADSIGASANWWRLEGDLTAKIILERRRM